LRAGGQLKALEFVGTVEYPPLVVGPFPLEGEVGEELREEG